MRDDEFLALVRDQGGYTDQDEARKVTEAVLGVLASRITADEAQDLADQMPTPLDRPLRGSGVDAEASGEAFGVEEFYRRVAERTSSSAEAGRTHTTAVLSALPQAVSAGQVRHVVTQLPEDFAVLFNR